MSTTQKDNKKEPNDIRIGMNSRPRNVIKYSTSIMEEKKLTELKFSAVGGSIGRLLDIVEVLKVLKPGLYQQNRITSVAYQTVDSNNTLLNQRLYPKLEVILSTEEPKVKTPEGYQGKLEEEKRKELEKVLNERREKMEKNRGRGTGRGRGRGGQRGRGRRGGFRGRRGNYRGRPRRGDSRPRRGDSRRGRRGQQSRGTGRGNRGRGTARGNKGRGGNTNTTSK
jgi:hypothetical protein